MTQGRRGGWRGAPRTVTERPADRRSDAQAMTADTRNQERPQGGAAPQSRRRGLASTCGACAQAARAAVVLGAGGRGAIRGRAPRRPGSTGGA